MNRSFVLMALAASTLLHAESVKVTDVEAKYAAKKSVVASENLEQRIDLGFANTSGNTDTMNLNGKYEATFTTVGYANNPLKVAFDASLFVTENNDVKDNEEYKANLGLEQSLFDGWLGYASINWLRNEFQNYDNKYAFGAGVGREIFNDGKQSLKLKLGVAYNIEDYSNDQAKEEFGSLNEYAEYLNKLNEVSTLSLKVGAMQNFDDFSNDYELTAVAGVNFAVAENINVVLEEEIAYDALPPVGYDKTDTKTIVRIGYSF